MKKRKLKRRIRHRLRIFLLLLSFIGVGLFLFHGRTRNTLTTKTSMIMEVFQNRDRIDKFVSQYDTYPEILLLMLERNPDMLDYIIDYPEKVGNVYSDTIGQINEGEIPLLLQYDQRWGYGMYGNDVIAIEGCAPTSLAMVIAGLTKDNTITPKVVADYAFQNGYYVSGSGSSWTLMTDGSKHFGLHAEVIPLVQRTIFRHLESGNPIIASVGPGDFTKSGHFIVLVGIENGKIKVNDPNSRVNSEMLWDYDTLESQIKNLWVFTLQ